VRKVAEIRRFVERAKRNPAFRRQVASWVHHLPEKDHDAEIGEVVDRIRSGVRYLRDPVDVELFTSPGQLLKDLLSGEAAEDCDGHVILAQAALETIGYPTRSRVGGDPPDRYRHIWLEVLHPSRGWLPVEMVKKDRPVGWDPSPRFPLTETHVGLGDLMAFYAIEPQPDGRVSRFMTYPDQSDEDAYEVATFGTLGAMSCGIEGLGKFKLKKLTKGLKKIHKKLSPLKVLKKIHKKFSPLAILKKVMKKKGKGGGGEEGYSPEPPMAPMESGEQPQYESMQMTEGYQVPSGSAPPVQISYPRYPGPQPSYEPSYQPSYEETPYDGVYQRETEFPVDVPGTEFTAPYVPDMPDVDWASTPQDYEPAPYESEATSWGLGGPRPKKVKTKTILKKIGKVAGKVIQAIPQFLPNKTGSPGGVFKGQQGPPGGPKLKVLAGGRAINPLLLIGGAGLALFFLMRKK